MYIIANQHVQLKVNDIHDKLLYICRKYLVTTPKA